ncbi:MAG TPA: amino acid adenylation domain-containing protein, partial [Longimicrobiaceae bacterium]|nr:amino acid adenylation domain-containing protein [Longimicrobiaceae bacterium]
MGRVREGALGAYAHQELPFERLVEELVTERSLTHAPLFQATFALLQDAGRNGGSALGGVELEPFGSGEEVAKFDLTLSLVDRDPSLSGVLAYRKALFEPATIERMAGHFQVVLETMASEPGRRLSELSLLRGAEREQVLGTWSAAALEDPGAYVHEIFRTLAGRTPGAAAVVCGDQVLTYAELERTANRVARYLRRLGVGPEVRVGVCVDGGVETFVGVMGILRAGGAYVPLDPSYPPERLAFLLRDSAVAVLLTTSTVQDRLPEHSARTVCLDLDREHIAAEPDDAPVVELSPENLAYVIYTSGSTGKPKGVLVSHRNLACSTAARFTRYAEPLRSFLLLSSTSFDSSVAGIFWTLCSGGTLHLPVPGAQRDVARLVEIAAAADISHLLCVPSLYAGLLDEAERHGGWAPAVAVVAGEACPRELVDRHARVLPGTALYNEYGPTEATVWCASHACAPEEAGRVPIGRPVPGARCYLLDRGMEPVPAGVPAELHVGGEGVARGYLAHPGLSAERFVPDPFSPETGARMYRTGDLARWRTDGTLEFLGRIDEQVKIRGFRVEVGEVEAMLAEHPRVHDVAVAAREDARGQVHLVAYVVAEAGTEDPAPILRPYLRERLPEHMVPSVFVGLERLPLTPNGKVDRRALPAPPWGAGEAYVAPRTPSEELLCGIWAEVLGAERVGIEADFFALGGHSLLAMRLISRVRQAFGVELPLRALFEAPTVAGLSRRVEEARRDGAGMQPPPLVPAARDGAPLPLSFAQQRLWFIDQLEPGRPTYNMPFPLRIRGGLELRALERALTEVVRRHESLRTRFPSRRGEPVQEIDPARPVQVPVVDLGGLGARAREAELARLAAEEAARPFDLARGPLLRTTLVRSGGAEWAVLFTVHHIVSDGWSMDVLVREVSALYRSYTRGEEARLPELPIQYADYAAWQRGWLAGEVLEAHLDYWREKLAGAPPLLELPTDHPRPQVQDPRGEGVYFELSPELSGALRALSRTEGATVFMTLLAGLQLLLARYSGQDDVPVGSPIANRTRLETEGLIGFFANTLVLRTDLSGDPTVRELLGRVRETVLGAYQHQEIPFERLVEELAPERSLAHTPLFQVLFVLQNAEPEDLRLGALETEPMSVALETAKFDLTFAMHVGERIAGSVSYRSSLWRRDTMTRLLSSFERLLEGTVAEPRRRVGEIDLLTGAERLQVQVWNATESELPAVCVHELFERQAAETPDAVALTWGDRSLTYAELEARANRLAHRLLRLGVGPDARVALCATRSVEMLVGVLAVLRAGGAYVPLDPEYPADRLAYMLEDSGARVLLTQAVLAERLPPCDVARVLLDAEGEGGAHESAEPPTVALDPENLAYVIYTSGSTGRPKGVAMQHRPLVNLLAWQERDWWSPGAAVTLHFATISFDASFHEIFSCWSTGGRVVLADEETRRDPAAVLRLVESEGVGRVFMPAVALQHLAEEALARGVSLPALREVQTAGEALRVTPAIREWFTGTGIPLHNHYGPSETHVVTRHTLAGDTAHWPLLPSIGGPIANTQCYVLDAHLLPAPLGGVGELYLGGASLARGYLGRPELTAARFLPDPFPAAPGARMYRTGDRVRWLAGGVLEFLGRVDQQVKVRGFRVEPGEVEAALERHPGVREAVVYVREEAPGNRRLVGYVVPEGGGEAPTAGELRRFLGGSLPEYMVPGAFVVLEALPVTPSGKVDRRALPAPEGSSGEEYLAPRTPTEEILAGIWAEVLGAERVGATEDFFALGGHSLLATRVISRVREAFGTELPLRALFEVPTVAGLAERIEQARREGSGLRVPPVVRVPREGPLPLSFAQQRLWFLDRLEPGRSTYNLPYALRIRGGLDLRALQRALTELVRRHESLRTRFPVLDAQPVQWIEPARTLRLPLVDLGGVPGDARDAELARLVAEEARRPFDLATGPLLRATVARLGEEEVGVLLTLH